MDYNKPSQIAANMVQAGVDKMALTNTDLLIRGILSGAILGFGTTLALTATVQTGLAIIGAALFPACFIIVVLLGLELVTGSFAVLPMLYLDKQVDARSLSKNLLLVFLGNLIGGILYASLFCVSTTQFGHEEKNAIALLIVKIAEAKTLGYASYGFDGLLSAFTKGILCNWMVTTGVVLGMSSTSSTGKILASWLPIFIFFGQGFEHAVVNMFLIPAGMMLGANVSFADWWLCNQLPVTLGNLVGGILFTAMPLYYSFYKKTKKISRIEKGYPIPTKQVSIDVKEEQFS
ncbi:formate/nitrite transporter family protein [Olivibacter sp. CPCC 100613]|uniref:formate/nitrite transporter family protein n=1 Tax=Olivibacter sp. CPCC 100613 TaxID=3079931 RepID=UPI002FF8F843